MASSLPLNIEEWPLLPMEVWHQIWSFVAGDFETLQKSCVAVSKTWFNGIRDSPTLSSEMKIISKKGNEELSNEDFDGILSKWSKLKILDLSEFKAGKIQLLISTNKINLKALPLLEKIIAKPDSYMEALNELGEVQKIWINPKDFQAPIKLENVFWLKFYPAACFLPEEFIATMQEIGPMMKNIESLDVPIVNQETLSWILNFTNLKKIQLGFNYGHQPMVISETSRQENIKLFLGDIASILTSPHILILERDCNIDCAISSLLDMVNALATMKNPQILECAIHFYCDRGCYLDKQEIKDVLEKATKIIVQKLPNETVSITHGFYLRL